MWSKISILAWSRSLDHLRSLLIIHESVTWVMPDLKIRIGMISRLKHIRSITKTVFIGAYSKYDTVYTRCVHAQTCTRTNPSNTISLSLINNPGWAILSWLSVGFILFEALVARMPWKWSTLELHSKLIFLVILAQKRIFIEANLFLIHLSNHESSIFDPLFGSTFFIGSCDMIHVTFDSCVKHTKDPILNNRWIVSEVDQMWVSRILVDQIENFVNGMHPSYED